MNAIRAFVGHSFTDDGKEVVRKFTDYFDSLEKMNDGFSWVCAKAAEPKLLTQKVMSLIQDRNLFIGICTRKELALDPTNLVKIPLLSKHVVNVASIQWKSLLSDLFASAAKVLMFVSDDEMEMTVLENPAAMSPKVFIMRRSRAVALLSNSH
jgi:hypothetical protein